jgi:hypothetical protein
MAFVNNKGHGYNDVASAVTFQTELVSVPAGPGAAVTSVELGNRGMPRVVVFLRQTVGAVPGTATIEFSTSDSSNKVKTWFPAGTAVPTPLNVPVLVPVELPAKFIRVSFARVAGQACTVQVSLMAAQ